ncbi:MAG: alpha/beta hydrolase [Firmicutes bacterium]|uniref:Alpha/beta hydrolase n=1 Tax=Candidatus Scybalomonas excrementavium TaxID=2840943 RepID=A0A9D9HYI0_9FIRM|nr:alpha/beta hydrolase [Candidatus Scybalomonas excrementavium]
MKYLFLHGLGQNASSWEKTVSHIDVSDEAICLNVFDLLAGISQAEMTYEKLYQSFVKYCSDLSEPFHVCGLSLGGILALQYTIENPEKVRSLIVIGIQFVMPKGLLKIQTIIFQFMPNRLFEKMGLHKKDMITLSNSMLHLNFSEDLDKISCPVLVLCGEKDKANKKAAMELYNLLPNAKLQFIKQAGHEVNVDNPKELGEAIQKFYHRDKGQEE